MTFLMIFQSQHSLDHCKTNYTTWKTLRVKYNFDNVLLQFLICSKDVVKFMHYLQCVVSFSANSNLISILQKDENYLKARYFPKFLFS